jgi:hypothetical protein
MHITLNRCVAVSPQDDERCLSGFSISGSTDSSLRNYSRMWEQIRGYKQQQGAAALKNFTLNILGQIMDSFTVPGVRYDGVLACAANIQHCPSSAAKLGDNQQNQ